jgi:hypothetical protein
VKRIDICSHCGSQCYCVECEKGKFNRPLVVKYFNQEMPIIVHRCEGCNTELFRSMTYEQKTLYRNYCLMCDELKGK